METSTEIDSKTKVPGMSKAAVLRRAAVDIPAGSCLHKSWARQLSVSPTIIIAACGFLDWPSAPAQHVKVHTSTYTKVQQWLDEITEDTKWDTNQIVAERFHLTCLLYTSDAADE